jgi:hypothetical protein
MSSQWSRPFTIGGIEVIAFFTADMVPQLVYAVGEDTLSHGAGNDSIGEGLVKGLCRIDVELIAKTQGFAEFLIVFVPG